MFALFLVSGCSAQQSREYQFAEDAQDGGYVRPTRAAGESEAGKEPTYFTIQVNASPTVSESGKRCNLMVGNPSENEQNVIVRLVLDATGEELYCSELLKPGERSAYVDLDPVPGAGEHTATAVFMVYDPETSEQISEIDVGVLLTVTK